VKSHLQLEPKLASAQALAPYGTLVEPTEDGAIFDSTSAQLVLDRGTPRFYLMSLKKRDLLVTHITRHAQVTQCLAALNGQRWFILLGAPEEPDNSLAVPNEQTLQAFEFNGPQALSLHRGTWHAGPYFLSDEMIFSNLELSNTNVVDHQTNRLNTSISLVPVSTDTYL
jgi:ureidoglycolate lyase